ncbi:MAG: aminoacyl-tRNA hydrolase, partial [Desulfovermiculus sp.]
SGPAPGAGLKTYVPAAHESMPAIDFLIAGLGNPGSRYVRTRHNIGFMTVEYLVRHAQGGVQSVPCGRCQSRCWLWSGLDDKQSLLAEPQTYMNLSGKALRSLCRAYNVQADQVVVIHDELDLSLGRVRLKFGGGLAGHNGLKSIAQELGTRDFYRVRMGIGRPEPGTEVTRHVLSSFFPWEQDQLSNALTRAAEGIRLLCTQGMQSSMNYVHADQD